MIMHGAAHIQDTGTVRARLAMILFFGAIVLPLAAEALAIIILNGGVFGYTVDDGYIVFFR